MSDLKTKKNRVSVEKFLQQTADGDKLVDCQILLELMHQATGEEPVMWGKSLIGFGRYHYKYASGREGDSFITGFSPRKQNITIYIMPGFTQLEKHLVKLGKFKTAKTCLYIKKISDIDIKTLKKLIQQSIKIMQKNYP